MDTSRITRPDTPQKPQKRTSRTTAKSVIDLTADEDEPYISPAAPKKRPRYQAVNEDRTVSHTSPWDKRQKTEHDFHAVGVFMTGKGNIYVRIGQNTTKLHNQSRASLDERLQEWLLHGLTEADAIRIHIKLRDTSRPGSANHMLYLLASVLAESEQRTSRKVTLTLSNFKEISDQEIVRLLSPIARLHNATKLELCGISNWAANELSAKLVDTRSGTALNDWRQLDRRVEGFLTTPAANALGWYKAKIWRDMVLGRKPYILDGKTIFDFSNENREQYASQEINECRMELDTEWQEF